MVCEKKGPRRYGQEDGDMLTYGGQELHTEPVAPAKGFAAGSRKRMFCCPDKSMHYRAENEGPPRTWL